MTMVALQSSSAAATTMRTTITLLLTIFLLAGTATTTSVVGAAEIGKPHSTVINLKDKNFEDHLNDPANGLWLIKFYAPWCGHCKKLEPVLDAVAPFLAGKMSIGKVDCTLEKSLCKRYNVKGYPTLKYYRDGDFQDYPLGRDADSIILFGEKMSTRAVKIVSSHGEAENELLILSNIPVAFIAYDPNASSGGEESTIDASGATDDEKKTEKMIQSTERTRVFGQVARKMQAQGSFGLLSPNTDPEEIAQFFDGDAAKVPSGGFIARFEEGVPTKIYDGELTTSALMEFVIESNIAVVIELGGHNFRFVSRRGKALAIVVYDPEEDAKTNKYRRELKQYAIGGRFKDDYIFAAMDGIKWDKFLNQFSITRDNLPELFVVDVPERTYWQDASVFGISDFITAVKNGEIESREQEKPKRGPLDEFLQVFVDYMPWSLLAMFALFITVFYLALPHLDSGLVMPPMPPAPESTSLPKKKEDSKGRIVEDYDSDADDANKKDQ